MPVPRNVQLLFVTTARRATSVTCCTIRHAARGQSSSSSSRHASTSSRPQDETSELRTRRKRTATGGGGGGGGGTVGGSGGGMQDGPGTSEPIGTLRDDESQKGWEALNPRKLTRYLDQYVVGQDRPKKVLAVAVYNHYQRVRANLQHQEEADEYSYFLSQQQQHDQSSSSSNMEEPPVAGPSLSSSSYPDPSVLQGQPYARTTSSGAYRRDEFMSNDTFVEDDAVIVEEPPLPRPRKGSSKLSPSSSSSSSSSSSNPAPPPPQYPSDDIHDSSILTGEGRDFEGQRSGTPLPTPPRQNNTLPPHLQPSIFEKSNVLMIGPTGSGKTLLARTLARVLDVPFASCEATTFTQAGYVGEDVESCVQRLLQAANWDIKRASHGIIFLDEIDKIARRPGASEYSKDVSGEGVQQALLRMLEGCIVSVSDKTGVGPISGGPGSGSDAGPLSGGVGGGGGRNNRRTTREGLPGQGPTVGSGIGGSVGTGPMTGGAGAGGTGANVVGGKGDTFLVDTSNILFILSGAFVGLDKVIRGRVAKGSIGFSARLPPSKSKLSSAASTLKDLGIDTKDASKSSFLPFFTPNTLGEKQDQPDLLDLVEPSDLVSYGFIPEFIGRLPIIASLRRLTEEDLLRVLTEPRNALVRQYESLFGFSGIECRFTTPALREIARGAIGKQTGARGLRRILENVLLDPMYTAPQSNIRYVLITRSTVLGQSPAAYFSRAQQAAFYSALAAEEEADARERDDKLSNEAKEDDEGEQSWQNEVAEQLPPSPPPREEERPRRKAVGFA